MTRKLLFLAATAVAAAPLALAGAPQATDVKKDYAPLHQLFLHDECTGEYAPQPDTCLHKQLVEKVVTIGGKPNEIADVTLRVRGLFEPTTIVGGETPLADHPYYQVGGTIRARDWSAWRIEVAEPKQTYWLNHYPKVGHVIYNEDFQVTIPMAGGTSVAVRVTDGNDRQMDNLEEGRPDRMQIIKGVQDKPLGGQMLRLDVIGARLK